MVRKCWLINGDRHIVVWAIQFACCCNDGEWAEDMMAVCARREQIQHFGRGHLERDVWEDDNCRALGWKVDRTGSGSCLLAGGFGYDIVIPYYSTSFPL